MTHEPDPSLQPHLTQIAAIVSQLQGSDIERRRAGSLVSSTYAAAHTPAALKAPPMATKDAMVAAPGRLIPTRTYSGGVDNKLTLIYFHGGGWMAGDLESHDELLRRVAHQLGCTLVAVDYRLAPEHPMPAALEDAAEVIRHVRESIKDTPGARFALGGDSSGAHLAASAAHSLAQDAAGLLLLYPVVRPDFTTPSYTQRGSGTLTTATMRWFWEQYLDRTINGDALATGDANIDLLKQQWPTAPPPAVVLTAWHDPLCDEGNAYALHLAGAGGEVRHSCANGMPHGFVRLAGINTAAHQHLRQAVDDFAQLVAKRLAG
jgi:acetyl esterase